MHNARSTKQSPSVDGGQRSRGVHPSGERDVGSSQKARRAHSKNDEMHSDRGIQEYDRHSFGTEVSGEIDDEYQDVGSSQKAKRVHSKSIRTHPDRNVEE
eukprot:12630040-Ditylum_brightwellii.AAC.1